MSRFNALLLGEPDEAADLLENFDGADASEINVDELRLALINALKRIALLERRLISGPPLDIPNFLRQNDD